MIAASRAHPKRRGGGGRARQRGRVGAGSGALLGVLALALALGSGCRPVRAGGAAQTDGSWELAELARACVAALAKNDEAGFVRCWADLALARQALTGVMATFARQEGLPEEAAEKATLEHFARLARELPARFRAIRTAGERAGVEWPRAVYESLRAVVWHAVNEGYTCGRLRVVFRCGAERFALDLDDAYRFPRVGWRATDLPRTEVRRLQ